MGNIIPYIMNIGPWSWLILGCILLGLEVLLPGTFMLWFGVAAIVTGVLSFLAPIGLELQLIVFAIVSLISVLIGRKLYSSNEAASDQPLLHKRGAQLIGHSFKVTKAIENGKGKVKVGDSEWIVKGEDAEVGTIIKVVALDGNTLIVEH
ncbi:MAG: membrane protein [Methyloligella sp.]|jgi:membrane protein implicated in regulation of membrane protease activity|nr:MAG: membrane protein [Methyloligella sp.]